MFHSYLAAVSHLLSLYRCDCFGQRCVAKATGFRRRDLDSDDDDDDDDCRCSSYCCCCCC